jgi:hypothetical protein
MRGLLVPALVVLIVVGGCTAPSTPPPADPGRASAQPLRPRAGHSATLLADGRVLIAGGCAVDGCTTSEVEPSSEFYVPGQGFVAGPPMLHPRSSHTATLLPDGRVLIVGGWAREGTAPLTEAEVFDPTTATFQPAEAPPPGPAGLQPRHAASIVLPDGDILITGGQGAAGTGLSSTVVYDPDSGASRSGPPMGGPRFKHAIAMLDAGHVLVLGGTTDDAVLLTSTEVLDLATMEFTPGPAMSTPRYKFADAVVRTTTGRLVVAGGTQVDVLAPDGQSFGVIPIGNAKRRWASTATALPDGTVLVVGGYDGRIRVHSDAHIIDAGP